MRLRIVTPLSVVVDEDDVRPSGREDASGCFGLLPGHADFLTSLTVSVVSAGEALTGGGGIAPSGAASCP